MAKFVASRLVGKFLPKAGGTLIQFGITGFNVSGGDRNMIDITTGADARRYSYAGLASPLTATVNFIYQGEITALDEALTFCEVGQLWVSSTDDGGDCAAADILGTDGSAGLYVQCTGYTIEAELDGAVTGTASFERVADPVVIGGG